VETVSSFLCGGLFYLLLNFFKLSCAVLLLSMQAPEMMLASGPVLLIFFILVWIFRRRQFELSARINEAAAEYRRNMQNSLDRMTLFKSRSAELRVDRRVGRNLDRLTMLRLSRVHWERFYTVSLQLIPALWCGLVWCYGAAQVLNKNWTLGELWAVSGYMLLIFSPGKMLFSGVLSKRNSDAAMARLLELKRMLPENCNENAACKTKAASGSVSFDRISFAYPGSRSVFNGFSLEIKDGEHIGIYGPSGGGKSTLGALLLRLYDVSAGEIRLDGRPLKDYSLYALRQSVGYIGQATELFYASVRENLSHGGGYSDARICEALRQVGLGARLDENPELLDLQIREDGSNFSAGERLKLALARELLRDTKVLVLDEATASLDRESEKTVFELLRGEWEKRSVIFISHREFPDGEMDRVIKIGI
jgi:ABC-type multidrug transport system fused ATPase/permease subunit